jgi:outer membrane biogenesis lipoprotein LolB
MTASRPTLAVLAALALLLLAACSWDEVRGTASRTVRNVCANAPNCTVYEEGEPAQKGGLDPWDTKR